MAGQGLAGQALTPWEREAGARVEQARATSKVMHAWRTACSAATQRGEGRAALKIQIRGGAADLGKPAVSLPDRTPPRALRLYCWAVQMSVALVVQAEVQVPLPQAVQELPTLAVQVPPPLAVRQRLVEAVHPALRDKGSVVSQAQRRL